MDTTVCVRKATPYDKQAVLQINDNIYDGMDYLPAYYDYFQTSDHVTSYVYTGDEKIIAFVACLRNDNGETMVTRAGRVSPEHQGKQLYKSFISEVEKRQKENNFIIHHALIRGTDASASFLRTYKPVSPKATHWFKYNRSIASRKLKLLTANYRSKTKEIDNIPAYCLSHPYSNYLFPEGRVVVEWVPFRPLLANVHLFKGRNTVFLSDTFHAGETDLQREAKETTMPQDTAQALSDPIQGMLSACTMYKVNNLSDLSCVVDIFGNDIRSLKDHIITHLQRVEATGIENIILTVFTTKGAYEGSLLNAILGSVDIERIETDSRTEFIVYEKEIGRFINGSF